MEYTDQLKNRIKRMEGQVRGVLRLMEEQRDCKELVSQLSTVRNLADKAIACVVASNLMCCLTEYPHSDKDTEKKLKQAIELLVKSH